jgi:hypothetical protein
MKIHVLPDSCKVGLLERFSRAYARTVEFCLIEYRICLLFVLHSRQIFFCSFSQFARTSLRVQAENSCLGFLAIFEVEVEVEVIPFRELPEFPSEEIFCGIHPAAGMARALETSTRA